MSLQERLMDAAWRRLEARGCSVRSVRISPVGDVFLLTESGAEDLASANDDWVSLAGEKALPGA